MNQDPSAAGRLPFWRAALVVARRDFVAVLFSRAFIFFLLGPLFMIFIAGVAGGLGRQVAVDTAPPEIGIAMSSKDMEAMLGAYEQLKPRLGSALPRMTELKQLQAGESFDASALLEERTGNIAAIVTGSPSAPVLTATPERLDWWKGPVSLVAAQAIDSSPIEYPPVKLTGVSTSGAKQKSGRMGTAQAGQTLLFLLIMLLAGMVLSNLVEEKANKIIEVLAAAVPMDAVFLGKLFAMLGVSLVGITVWGSVIGGLVFAAGTEGQLGEQLHESPHARGRLATLLWPCGIIYFAMGYLLLGSIFLAIGSMAATVREVQTLSMPVTMLQLLVFFFATFALTQTGKPIELAAIAFPLSSPFAMLARAATDSALWPHVLALAWQALSVAVFIKIGAALFRKRVMKSGPQAVKKRRRLRDFLPLARAQ